MAADSPAPQPALRAAAERERQVPAPVTDTGDGAPTLPQTARSRGRRRRDRSPAGRSSATCTLPPSPAPRRKIAGVHLTPGRQLGAGQLLRTAPRAPLVRTRAFPLLTLFKCNKRGRGSWIFFFKETFFLFASLIGGNSLPVRRCGPGRGQDQERARYCPVFVCCLRMLSDGGMDHLGEAAGSRGAAALHYDREVRAPSQPSVGPSGGPWEYLLLSLTTPRPPADPLPPPSHPLSKCQCCLH